MKELRIIDAGNVDYQKMLDFQRIQFNDKVKNAYIEDLLILCEHPHVYTIGKRGQENNMLVSESFLENIGAKLYHIERGGDITYHGYGQLVGYPILNLENYAMGLRGYIYNLEQAVINTIDHFGIKGDRMNGATGVWICDDRGKRKICAIGVRASRYATMHGFALNVNTDLRYFNYINPCGFTDKGVTSLKVEGGGLDVDFNNVKNLFVSEFKTLFGCEVK